MLGFLRMRLVVVLSLRMGDKMGLELLWRMIPGV